MNNIEFNLIDKIKYLIKEKNSLLNISKILCIDIHYLKYLCKKIKSDIIHNCKSDEFFLVLLIDNLLKVKSSDRFIFDDQYKILELIHLSDEEIIERLNFTYQKYVSFLKSMYFMLSVHDIKNVDKTYLNVIKNKLDNIYFPFNKRYKQVVINENENNVCILNKDESSNLPYGKIYDMDSDNFKFLIISDSHYGSVYENFSYLDKVYEYAIKNNIKYIVLTGDLIEGSVFSFERCKSEFRSIDAQVENVIKNYCYDDSIKNIILLGNHDFSCYYNQGIDISTSFSERKDFDIVGYKEAYIKVKDDYITLKHEISRIISAISNPKPVLTLVGHSHQYRCSFDDEGVILKVPTLSDVHSSKKYVINKGFIVGSFNYDGDELDNIELEYINFDNSDSFVFQRKIKKA